MGKTELNTEELFHLARIGLLGNGRQFAAIARKIARKLKREGDAAGDALLELISKEESTEQSVMRRATDTIAASSDEKQKLLIHSNAANVMAPILPAELNEQVDQIVAEHAQRDALADAGMDPILTALFIGPPGAGKTMTAHWIAHRLQFPVYTLDLSNVSSSLLGKTGSNIRSAFDFVRERPSVLLLDEIDAVAKGRDQDDIGEAKRIVTVLLQQLDQLSPGSLVIGASNHGELLDRAIWRRFEMIIDFPAATLETAREVAARALKLSTDEPIVSVVARLMVGRPLSEVSSLARQAKKREILFDEPILETVIKSEASRMQDGDKEQKHKLANVLVCSGVSQRQASLLTGLARETIRKLGA